MMLWKLVFERKDTTEHVIRLLWLTLEKRISWGEVHLGSRFPSVGHSLPFHSICPLIRYAQST